MKKTVVICDRCGAEIKEGNEFLKLEINAYKGRDFDICEKCADEFLMLVTHREPTSEEKKAMTCCAPAPERKDVNWDEIVESVDAGKKKPEEKKEDQKTPPFDAGKAQALRDANWPVKKIAEEMHVCPATVYNNTHPAAPRPKKPLEGF